MPLCQLCKMQAVAPDLVKFEGKNYHIVCARNKQDRVSLLNTVCRIFHFKGPGPKVLSQVKHFYQTGKYTYKGMERALIYHYEIKDGSIAKADEGIGIVPYVYQEAQDYFRHLERNVNKLEEAITKRAEPKIVKVAPQTIKKTYKEIDLSTLE